MMDASSTTLHPSILRGNFSSNETPDDSSEEDFSDENIDIADVYRTAEIAIPFSITIAVIIVLCATAVYAKIRKSRNVRRRNNVPNISGGVPLSIAAYQNQAFHPDNINNTSVSHGQYATPPPLYSAINETMSMPYRPTQLHQQLQPQQQSNGSFPVYNGYSCNISSLPVYTIQPTLPQYCESPPNYEDITKDESSPTGGVNSYNNIAFTDIGEESPNVSGNNAQQDAARISVNHPAVQSVSNSNPSILTDLHKQGDENQSAPSDLQPVVQNNEPQENENRSDVETVIDNTTDTTPSAGLNTSFNTTLTTQAETNSRADNI